MLNSSFKTLVLSSLSALLLSAASAHAELSVRYFGPHGVATDQVIEPLNTIIGSNFDRAPDYWSIQSSNTDIKFIRHILSAEECLYWFRAEEGPDSFVFLETEEYSTSYWYAECLFVDGAQNGSNNFVLLHSSVSNQVVGVLQYAFNDLYDIHSPALLLAYAVDPDGITFEEAIAAIQAIPEPSTLAFVSIAAFGGLLLLRRRTRN